MCHRRAFQLPAFRQEQWHGEFTLKRVFPKRDSLRARPQGGLSTPIVPSTPEEAAIQNCDGMLKLADRARTIAAEKDGCCWIRLWWHIEGESSPIYDGTSTRVHARSLAPDQSADLHVLTGDSPEVCAVPECRAPNQAVAESLSGQCASEMTWHDLLRSCMGPKRLG